MFHGIFSASSHMVGSCVSTNSPIDVVSILDDTVMFACYLFVEVSSQKNPIDVSTMAHLRRPLNVRGEFGNEVHVSVLVAHCIERAYGFELHEHRGHLVLQDSQVNTAPVTSVPLSGSAVSLRSECLMERERPTVSERLLDFRRESKIAKFVAPKFVL